LRFNGEWAARRVLRDDVLENLYGKAAANPRRLIDEALTVYLNLARDSQELDLVAPSHAIMGLYPGATRTTEALSIGDALRQAALLHASLA
jgi:hypothetical protein